MVTRRRSRSRVARRESGLGALLGSPDGGSMINTKNAMDHLSSTAFWMYFAVSAIAAFWAWRYYNQARDEEFFNSLDNPSWGPTNHVFTIINTLFFLFIGYAGYKGFLMSGSFTDGHAMMFILVLVLNIVYPYVLLDKENVKAAFWLLIVMIIAVGWWAMMFWNKDMFTCLSLLTYLAWLVYLAFWNYNVSGDDVSL